MDETPEDDSRLKQLSTVLDDYVEWHGQVVATTFYPEVYARAAMPEKPDSLKALFLNLEKEEYVRKSVLQNLKRLSKELDDMALRILASSAKGQKPVAREFEAFSDLYESMTVQLRRLEHDAARADSGIDPASGLRSRKAMQAELERELERRARRGRPFGLALARIDDFERIKALGDDSVEQAAFGRIGQLILKCLRSFDDGYRSGEAEFVMCFKHADTAGSTAAINRLRQLMEQERIMVPDGKGALVPLTMSYCVAEPLPGDTLDDLMANMRNDLQNYRAGGDTALEYAEQSPLSRLIRSIGEPES